MTLGVSASNKHLTILATSFQTASADRYLHVIINTRTDAATLLGKPLLDRLTQIKTIEGIDPFTNPIGKNKWTPAHIAAIKGNKAALDLLQKNNAITDAVDKEGYTPRYYAELYHPEFLSYFRKPGEKATISFKNLFPASPSSNATYKAHTNDFGVNIKRLLFSERQITDVPFNRLDERLPMNMDHFVSNMEAIAKQQGFELVYANRAYYPRDLWIRLPSGKICLFSASPNIPEAIERADSYSLYHRTAGRYLAYHFFFLGRIGTSYKHGPSANKDMKDILSLSEDAPCLPFYIEGGDYYCVTTPEGVTKLVIAEDIFRIALNQLILDGAFADLNSSFADTIRSFEDSLQGDTALLNKTLLEMYTQGLLPPADGRKKGVVTRDEINKTMIIKHTELHNVIPTGVAVALDYYSMFKPPITPSSEDISRAAIYLVQQTLTKDLIAKAFGIGKTDLVLVPPVDYHIDLTMRPAPNNAMFVQDYTLCLQVLRRIQANAKDLELTNADKELLMRYIDAAEKLQYQIGSLLEKAKTALREAGIPVIPTPGIFYDDVTIDSYQRRPAHNANFMNAISGRSDETQQYYYIVAGAKAGDKLGALLMQSYEEFLQAHCPGIKVYYIGYDPANPSDFTEASNWTNNPASHASVHCFSFELETTTHQHSS